MSLTAKLLYCHQRLRKLRGEDGSYLCDPYRKLPEPELAEMYRSRITYPLSFLVIRNRIDKEKYHSVQEWAKDVSLLLSNATILAEGDPRKLENIEQLRNCLFEVIQETDPTNASPVNMSEGLEREALTSKVKFISYSSHGNVNYLPGATVRIKKAEGGPATIGRILRLWKYTYLRGAVCISYEYVNPAEANSASTQQKGLYLTMKIQICMMDDILGPCVVWHQSDPSGQAVPPQNTEYVCKGLVDDETRKVVPFVFKGVESFSYAIQCALQASRLKGADVTVLNCCFDPNCGKISHSIEALVRHSSVHIATRFNKNELSAAIGTSRHLSKRGRPRRSSPVGMSSYPLVPQAAQARPALPDPLSVAQDASIAPHPDYPIKLSRARSQIDYDASEDYIGDAYERDVSGHILWSKAPPLDVLPRAAPMHSIDYYTFQEKIMEQDAV